MTHRKPWTDRERRLIREAFAQGKTDVLIASRLDRTASAIQMERLALGLRHAPWASYRKRKGLWERELPE